MVDRDALSSRLDALESYLAELRSFERYSREEFVREPALHHLGERFLHLACECILDIAHHVIAEQGYRQAASYKDAMDVLREEGILDAALCERLKGWMGFRNVLAISIWTSIMVVPTTPFASWGTWRHSPLRWRVF